MKRKKVILYYSEDTVTYKEVNSTLHYAKYITYGVVGAVILLFSINIFFGEIATNATLIKENDILKKEIKTLHANLLEVTTTMDKLAKQDNELRLAVNLPTIDDDTRNLGIGGTEIPKTLGINSQDVSEVLSSSKQMLDKIEREIEFQKTSYQNIYKKSEENKVYFASLPAIKPMNGTFSYHGYGMRVHPILGVWKKHEGIDIHGETGRPVYATGDGTVEAAGRSGSGYGIVIKINHGFGYKTIYGHLSKVAVQPGRKVKRGDLIAYCGSTGLSTAPHLHYEVEYNGKKMNPVEYFVDDVDYRKIREQLAANSGTND